MKRRKYTKELLEEVAKESFSIRQMVLKFGLKQTGGNNTSMKKRLIKFEVDTSHFTGMLWSKGKTRIEDNRIFHKYSIEDIFCEESKVSIKHFKNILKSLIEYKCASCGNEGIWQEKEIVLEMEHKNGINNDNRLENLEFLCPNCHSQTSTFRGRNIKGKKRNENISEIVIIKAIDESYNIRQVLLKVGLVAKGANYERIKKIMLKNNLIFN
jgi:5-methylcytosine-specific restriction endonuclease McrA